MSVDQQLAIGIRLELGHSDRSKSTSLIACAMNAARPRASIGEPARPIRMQRTESANRGAVSHDRTDHSVAAVLLFAKTIPMLDDRPPSAEFAFPRADVVLDSDIVAKNFAAPAVVV